MTRSKLIPCFNKSFSPLAYPRTQSFTNFTLKLGQMRRSRFYNTRKYKNYYRRTPLESCVLLSLYTGFFLPTNQSNIHHIKHSHVSSSLITTSLQTCHPLPSSLHYPASPYTTRVLMTALPSMKDTLTPVAPPNLNIPTVTPAKSATMQTPTPNISNGAYP